MAGPIALAVALSRIVTITCPHCGYAKAVERKPVAYRVCSNCHTRFADPIATERR